MTSHSDAGVPAAESTGASPRALVLVGPMGAGKSSIGRRLARTLGVRFRDTDSAVVKEHGPIADIFAAHGEPHFRALEHEAVIAAVARGGVVALGGGAVLHPGTRAALRDHHVVLLTVEERVVAGRIRAQQKRPLLSGDGDPLDAWIRIRDAREPIYREVADAVFDTSRGPLGDVVTAIAAWVRAEDPAFAPGVPSEQQTTQDETALSAEDLSAEDPNAPVPGADGDKETTR
ncbi:shikimate kinase [Microbacterium paludicola]|uniref:Shikimate kinase n=1 Tax=Microbacterium paludicola TaxID=300019 RepID=A0A4Y9FX69_9MICO|nr:shikimate kinase [Microbacterium paludicola]MBF0815375.1 shikimate kinase [Microbacterium paludicola]TFU33916.1 shikimate kinase [Microbacterium paludicola]